MTDYEFSLVMEREPDELESAEIAAGIPTLYTMEGGPGSPSTAQFTVDDAETFVEAVTTSVRQMEAAGVPILGLEISDTVTVEEIAMRTGRDVESIRALASGSDGPGGFPPGSSADDGYSFYSWPQVARWFRVHHPEQDFEFDEQARAMDHILRARRFLRDHADDPTWITLFNT